MPLLSVPGATSTTSLVQSSPSSCCHGRRGWSWRASGRGPTGGWASGWRATRQELLDEELLDENAPVGADRLLDAFDTGEDGTDGLAVDVPGTGKGCIELDERFLLNFLSELDYIADIDPDAGRLGCALLTLTRDFRRYPLDRGSWSWRPIDLGRWRVWWPLNAYKYELVERVGREKPRKT